MLGMIDAMDGDEAPPAWDGEPGWPRPRHVAMSRWGGRGMAASCFVQSDPAEPLSASQPRLRACFELLVCQVCGEPVLSIDVVGWVLSPAANMGGACCTRCMYLAVRTCPHLAGADDGDFEFWAVSEPRHYGWHVIDATTKGHVVPDRSSAQLHTWDEYQDRYRAWKVAWREP